MDFTKYDKQIQRLAKEFDSCKQMLDPKAIPVLQRMRRRAVQTGDNVLLGYVHHSLAFANYFIEGDYNAFLKNIRLSARALVAARNESELMHVFYLVALDSLNRGMYDITYNYFLIARNLAKRNGDEVAAAIMNLNISHVLLQLHAYQDAASFFGRCLKELRKHRDHPHYYGNMLAGHLNEGAAYLALGKLSQAKRCLAAVTKFASRNASAIPAVYLFELQLFRARVAIAEGNRDRMRGALSSMRRLSSDISHTTLFTENLGILCDELMKEEEFDEVRSLIRIMEQHPPAEDALNARHLFVNLKTDFYLATGNQRKLDACFDEQDRIFNQLREEHKRASRFSNDMISLIDSLRREQRDIRKEHDMLLEQSLRDALTGLPNRRAFEEHMEEVFERAYSAGGLLGVAVLDLDDLKVYNDTYGHEEGDRCLKRVGNALKTAQRDERIFCARYGGDEFVMLFEDTKADEIRAVCRNIKKECGMELSVGVCNAVPHEKSRIWDYFSCADRALYRAKQNKDLKKSAQAGSFVRFERLRLFGAGV